MKVICIDMIAKKDIPTLDEIIEESPGVPEGVGKTIVDESEDDLDNLYNLPEWWDNNLIK